MTFPRRAALSAARGRSGDVNAIRRRPGWKALRRRSLFGIDAFAGARSLIDEACPARLLTRR
jgi:hypothetical protein